MYLRISDEYIGKELSYIILLDDADKLHVTLNTGYSAYSASDSTQTCRKIQRKTRIQTGSLATAIIQIFILPGVAPFGVASSNIVSRI
jgi:hypothetical protein